MNDPTLTLRICPGPEGHVWKATTAFRFVRRAVTETECMAAPFSRVLQQRWQNLTTGEWEWRDVPLESE